MKSRWVHPNGASQAATKWSEADQQTAKDRLERDIHQMTPVIYRLFDKLFQHHERQLLQQFWANATSTRSTFTRNLAQMKTAAKEEVYGAANITCDKYTEFEVCPSNVEIEATTCSVGDTDCVANQLQGEIDGIPSNERMQFQKELCIGLIKFKARWKEIGSQELRKTIEQCVKHFRYPKMHLVHHLSESIQ